jgi:hypothetical protein
MLISNPLKGLKNVRKKLLMKKYILFFITVSKSVRPITFLLLPMYLVLLTFLKPLNFAGTSAVAGVIVVIPVPAVAGVPDVVGVPTVA